MKFLDFDRVIAERWVALAEADDSDRAERLMALGDTYHQSTSGSNDPESRRLAGRLLTLLADVEWAALGRLGFRHATGTALEPLYGHILDRMAAEPDVRVRAGMLRELHEVTTDALARKVLSDLPYAPHVVGWQEVSQ